MSTLNSTRLRELLDYNPDTGLFTTAEGARDAYLAAKKEHHPFANFERVA